MSGPIALIDVADGYRALVLDAGEEPFVFSEARLAAFETAVDSLARDSALRGVLVRARHASVFCAGADVDEISALADRAAARAAVERGQAAFAKLANLPCPTAALVHGAALGGGCELALACTVRVATEKARLGLPEVRLGILPAWGGSTRLPRLIGLVPALEAITGGRTFDARRALRAGLVDSVVAPEHLEREGLRLLEELRAGRSPRRPRPPLAKRLLAALPAGRGFVAGKARAAIFAETKGRYPAPPAALDVVLSQHGRSLAEGFALEANAVVELLFSRESRELVRLFRLSRDSARPPIYAAASAAAPCREIAVVGAGVMGAGIAQTTLLAGRAVRVIDRSAEALVRCRAAIHAEVAKKTAKRELERAAARRLLAGLSFSTEIDGIRGADLVIEAAPERRDVKDAVLRAVSTAAPRALIATNTSSFPLADLATSVAEPSRFLGLHFFNPAPKMPLVEVVRGPAADDATLARGVRFAKDLGKTPLVVADGPGFLVNRLLAPYLAEACRAAEEGAAPEAIDLDLETFGMPLGPFALMDTIGLDVLRDVGVHLAARGRGGVHPLAARLAEAGDLGRKTGRGFYTWSEDGRRLGPHRAATPRDERPAPPAGTFSRRLLAVMIAEARAALADGLVATPEEIDLGTVYGIGFPPFRGGLMRHAAAGEES